MASFNRVIMMGNLTRDPEYKQQQSGQAVCRLSLASNRQYRNKQSGQLVQEVCYIEVDVWGAQADNCRQYLQKGRPVLVEGRLKLDTWKEADGQARRKHSIVADRVIFLGASQQAEVGVDDTLNNTNRNFGYSQNMKGNDINDEISGEALFKDEAPFEDGLPF